MLAIMLICAVNKAAANASRLTVIALPLELLICALIWHIWLGCGGGVAAPAPHYWGGLEGSSAPPDLPSENYSVPTHASV